MLLDQRFPDREEIHLATCSDWHWGSMTCMEKSVQEWVDEIKEKKYLVMLMGDLIENSLPGSAGSVWEQKIPPKQQIEGVTQILEPIRGQILGAVGGNHSARTVRAVGIDPDELISYNLGVPYFGHTMAGRVQVGRAHWRIMAHHGAGGGGLLGSKLNVIAEKMTKVMPMMDLYLAGHTHADVAGSDTRTDIVLNKGKAHLKKQIRHFSGTGSLLSYDGSYAEAKILPPASPCQVVHVLGNSVHRRRGGSGYDKLYRRYPRYFF